MIAPPIQARSRRTLNRIVEASRALIAERGRDGLTVQDVVVRARTSVGSFYARFSGREALLGYLDQEMTASALERWDLALADRIPADAPLSACVRALAELVVSDPGDGLPDVDRHRRATAMGALLERKGEIRHPRAELAVELGWAAALGAARMRPDGWEDGRLAEELARLWQGYLQAGVAADPAKGGVDFFQVWT